MKKINQIFRFLGIAVILLFTAGIVCTHVRDDKSVEAESTKTDKKTFTVKKFNNVKLSAYRPDITIASGKKYQVTISGSQGADINKIKTKVKNKQLTIFDKSEKTYNDGIYNVYITVPHKYTLKKVAGFCDVGNLSLINLSIPTVSFKSRTGSMTLKNTKVPRIYYQAKSGDFIAKNSKFKASVSVGDAGDVKIKKSTILGDSSFKLNIGSFIMDYVPGISYELTTKYPNTVRVHNKNYSHHYSKIIPNKSLVKVNSKIGNIRIN